MPSLSPSLSETIAQSWGIVTADQLLGDGLSSSMIRQLVRDRTLVGVHSGVYRMATSPLSFEARCVAACLADPHVLVTGLAAAQLWKFRHTPRREVPEVLTWHGQSPLAGGVVLRRSNVITAEDVVKRPDRIRVASPPRAWCDCAVHVDDAGSRS